MLTRFVSSSNAVVLLLFFFSLLDQMWERMPEQLSTSTATSSAYALWAVSIAGSLGFTAM